MANSVSVKDHNESLCCFAAASMFVLYVHVVCYQECACTVYGVCCVMRVVCSVVALVF